MKLERIAFGTIYFGLAVIVIAIGLFLWRENLSTDNHVNEDKLGAFGSFVSGMAGTVWALAGVLLFYVALKEQRRDIEMNRDALQLQVEALNQQIKEFELQRIELEETRKVFEEQTETQRLQRFEQTLFQLLHLHTETVQNLSSKKFSSDGRDVFDGVKRDLESFIEGIRESRYDGYGGTISVIIDKAINVEQVNQYLTKYYYDYFYKDHEQNLSHYFRQLYHIFKFIHNSNLIEDEKKSFYATLVRAQLSQNELYALLFNSMIEDQGNPRFLYLINKYNLLKNFNSSDIGNQLFLEYFHALQKKVEDPF